MTGKNCIQRTNVYLTTQKGRQKMDYSQNTGFKNKSMAQKTVEDLQTTKLILLTLLDSKLECNDLDNLHEITITLQIISDIYNKAKKQLNDII